MGFPERNRFNFLWIKFGNPNRHVSSDNSTVILPYKCKTTNLWRNVLLFASWVMATIWQSSVCMQSNTCCYVICWYIRLSYVVNIVYKCQDDSMVKCVVMLVENKFKPLTKCDFLSTFFVFNERLIGFLSSLNKEWCGCLFVTFDVWRLTLPKSDDMFVWQLSVCMQTITYCYVMLC